jgi:hypothetical protein
MKCEDFKLAYQRFDAKSKVIQLRAFESIKYEDYLKHREVCPACDNWWLGEEARRREIDVSLYPCNHMAYYASPDQCDLHDDPWECTDYALVWIDMFDEYGIPIRDGGTSYYSLTFCPWCGIKLPESKRELWYQRMSEMGIDPDDEEKIPEAYQSSQWFRV